MADASTTQSSRLVRLFSAVERWGQKLPDPLTLFAIMAALVAVLSAVFSGTTAEVIQRTGDVKEMTVKSLLNFEGIRYMLLSAVDNFIQFAPLGPVLTVMIGIGVAERTGFISMGLKVLVTKVPPSFLTATVVFAGVMSSMAADAGYVVLGSGKLYHKGAPPANDVPLSWSDAADVAPAAPYVDWHGDMCPTLDGGTHAIDRQFELINRIVAIPGCVLNRRPNGTGFTSARH